MSYEGLDFKEKQQTTLQKVIDWIEQSPIEQVLGKKQIKDKIKSLLPEEKQMVIDAYERGDKYKFEISGEQYFNETFQQEKR